MVDHDCDFARRPETYRHMVNPGILVQENSVCGRVVVRVSITESAMATSANATVVVAGVAATDAH